MVPITCIWGSFSSSQEGGNPPTPLGRCVTKKLGKPRVIAIVMLLVALLNHVLQFKSSFILTSRDEFELL